MEVLKNILANVNYKTKNSLTKEWLVLVMKELSVYKTCKDWNYPLRSDYFEDNMAISIAQKEISDI